MNLISSHRLWYSNETDFSSQREHVDVDSSVGINLITQVDSGAPSTAMRRTLPSFRMSTADMTNSGEHAIRWLKRCRLLDAARGVGVISADSDAGGGSNKGHQNKHRNQNLSNHLPGTSILSHQKRRLLPVFPLQAKHFASNNTYDAVQKSSSSQTVAAEAAPSAMTPKDFHRVLCDRIRNAKQRVLLASLYVGPAASPRAQPEEVELLQALRDVSSRSCSETLKDGADTSADDNPSERNQEQQVRVRVVLDENRALRPVPVSSSSSGTKSQDSQTMTTSSAKAVAEALLYSPPSSSTSSSSKSTTDGNGVYLFQVLSSSPLLKAMLPNPLDEVAGVFHIKAYVIDDELIISGANLSQEYFVDRQDRYLHLVDGANGLVDFYADLIDILCQHSSSRMVISRSTSEADNVKMESHHNDVDIDALLDAITLHFQEKAGSDGNYNISSANDLFSSLPKDNSSGNSNDDDEMIVAVAIPTFQAPEGFFGGKKDNELGFVSDVEATMGLLHEASRNEDVTGKEESIEDAAGQRSIVQLSSAYLNPTPGLVESLAQFDSVELLTASRMSHGFKPKKKAGNKGKDWIPTVFDYLTAQIWDQLERLQRTNRLATRSLYHWERPDWTFHAKGLWLRHLENNIDEGTGKDLSAAIVGSSNFGERSFKRDMESNIILVFPPHTRNDEDLKTNSNVMQSSLNEEWSEMISSSRKVDPNKVAEEAPPLPWNVRFLLPFIKTFF